MLSKRLLVIEKLVFAVPDNIPSTSEEMTIDDALIALIAYRSSLQAVDANQLGDFFHTAITLPSNCNPEDGMQLTKDRLLEYLSEDTNKAAIAGAMYSLVYDDELKSYRNAYSQKSLEKFKMRYAEYTKALQEAGIAEAEDVPESIEVKKGTAAEVKEADESADS